MFGNHSDFAEQEAYYQVQNNHHGHHSHEVLAGAAAFMAMRAYENKAAREGHPPNHAFAKEMIAAFAAAEAERLIETRGLHYLDRERAKHEAAEQAKFALSHSNFHGPQHYRHERVPYYGGGYTGPHMNGRGYDEFGWGHGGIMMGGGGGVGRNHGNQRYGEDHFGGGGGDGYGGYMSQGSYGGGGSGGYVGDQGMMGYGGQDNGQRYGVPGFMASSEHAHPHHLSHHQQKELRAELRHEERKEREEEKWERKHHHHRY